MNYQNVEQFPQRKQVDELSADSQGKLLEYYEEKSKRPHDYYWKQADMISGGADYTTADEGEAPKQ